jgi:hypothetical protein
VPGRGNSYRRADLQKVMDYLTDMRTQVRQMMVERRAKFDPAELVPHFLDRFPVPAGENERVQRRIRTGLEKVTEELKAEKKSRKK